MGKIFKKQEKDLNRERIAECVPIAKEILRVIVESNLKMGEVDKGTDEYNEAAKKILQFMLDKNIKYVNNEFVFQLALQPLDMVRDLVTVSLKHSFDAALDKALGNSYQDVTMEDLNRLLKK